MNDQLETTTTKKEPRLSLVITLTVIALLCVAVTGAIALYSAAHPDATGAQIRAALLQSATSPAMIEAALQKIAEECNDEVNTAAGKPTLSIWEDFQCPACGQVERQAGKAIEKLATDGNPTGKTDGNMYTLAQMANTFNAVTGTWTFVSGAHHATWLGAMAPCFEEDGTPVRRPDGRPMLRVISDRPLVEPFVDVMRLHIAGHSPREIAARLDVNPNTVRSRLSRGLAWLRQRLELMLHPGS